METVEKECGALGGLFQAIVNDMKVERRIFFSHHLCSSLCSCSLWDAHPRRHAAGAQRWMMDVAHPEFLRRKLRKMYMESLTLFVETMMQRLPPPPTPPGCACKRQSISPRPPNPHPSYGEKTRFLRLCATQKPEKPHVWEAFFVRRGAPRS